MKRQHIWNSGALHVLTFMLVYVVHSALCASDCRFPKSLQHSGEGWVATYPTGATYTGHFKESAIHSKLCSYQNKCVEYVWTCKQKVRRNTYLVEHQEKDRPLMFVCVEFLARTDSILQLKTSRKALRITNVCQERWMSLDPVPIVAPSKFNKHSIVCPLSGGYNLALYRAGVYKICDESLVPPRVESECEVGEGLTFNFRQDGCLLPHSKMDIFQKVLCLAEWSDDRGHTFVILGHPSEFRGWCLRLKRSSSGELVEAHLFMDFLCDPGGHGGRITSTTNFLSLRLESVNVSSMCEDVFDNCQSERRLCEQDARKFCMRSCQVCHKESMRCKFADHVQGQWIKSSFGHNAHVSITQHDMRTHQSGWFECLDVKDGGTELSENRIVVAQVFENGCYPRYRCLELTKAAPSVLRYRFGESVTWPRLTIDNQMVCSLKQFQIDRTTGSSIRNNIAYRYLVRRDSPSRINCSLPGEFRLTNDPVQYELQYPDGTSCGGYLEHDAIDRPGKMALIPINCNATYHTTRQTDYRCIASFSLVHGYHGVLTETSNEHREYLCWIFSWVQKRRIFVFGAADCNMETLHLAEDDVNKPQMSLSIFPIDAEISTSETVDHIHVPEETDRVRNVATTPGILKQADNEYFPKRIEETQASSHASESLDMIEEDTLTLRSWENGPNRRSDLMTNKRRPEQESKVMLVQVTDDLSITKPTFEREPNGASDMKTQTSGSSRGWKHAANGISDRETDESITVGKSNNSSRLILEHDSGENSRQKIYGKDTLKSVAEKSNGTWNSTPAIVKLIQNEIGRSMPLRSSLVVLVGSYVIWFKILN